MYGPPPDCKRFEAGEATVWVNVSGLFAKNRSGLDDDPRVSVLINLSVTRDALSSAGFPIRRWTVVSSASLLSRPWWNLLPNFAAAVAVGKWKALYAFQAQRLFHGHHAASCSGGCRYSRPLDNTAQAMRASLLAIATTTLLWAARWASRCTHWPKPAVSYRMRNSTARAPWMSMRRR